MQQDPIAEHRRALSGIAFMTVAMLIIPVVDATAKWLSATHSPWFLGWVRYAMASIFVLPVAARVHGWSMFPTRHLIPHGLRTLFLVAAMTLYFLAIARVPLSTAVTAFFVGPILAVGLAIIFLGERLTLAKAVSLGIGFAGAVVILDPGRQIDLGIMLALASGAFFALYLIMTRQAAQVDPPLKTLSFQCTLGAVLLAPPAVMNWSTPDLAELGLFMAMGLVSAVSHILAITAFARSEASTLAPLVYVELISAVGLGWLLFDDVPTLAIWVGGGMIALAGLLLTRVQSV